MEGTISGAGLISPWILNPNSTSSTITANRPVDILDADALNYWARNFLGTAEADYWNCPLTIPAEHLRDLPVDNILVTYGDNETLKDDAIQFCDVLKSEHPCVTVMNFPGELHVHMVMNRFLFINKPCQSERVYVEWLQKQTASSTPEAQEEEKKDDDDDDRNRATASEPV
jgi:acetyl esterase/lipase